MNRMTVYDQMRQCFKVTTHQEPGRSIIQELGIYEDIHEEEIKKARNITDIRDLYFTNGAKLDPYWENFGKPKTERSGWIPVTERLPEYNQRVLVLEDTDYVFIAKRVKAEDNRLKEESWLDDDEHPFAFSNCHVIKWMPLPVPYDGEVDG